MPRSSRICCGSRLIRYEYTDTRASTPGKDLLEARSAADLIIFLQDQHAQAGHRQVGHAQARVPELWDRIGQKTRYSVHIDTPKLIADVVADLRNVHIAPPRVTITKAVVDLNMVDVFEAWQMSAAKTLVSLAGRYPLPNLVDLMLQLMQHTSPPMRLTRRTLLDIIRQAPYPQEVVDNPVDRATAAVGKIKARLSEQLRDGIRTIASTTGTP